MTSAAVPWSLPPDEESERATAASNLLFTFPPAVVSTESGVVDPMIFHELPIHGAYLIEPEARTDERGFFARTYCREQFRERGLTTDLVQCNESGSEAAATLRGMHYQLPPYAETKLVRCIRGKLYDVVLDLRKDSPTFGRSYGAELSSTNRRMMYVPKGCAHGFVTLQHRTEAFYLTDEVYAPEAERGVRWDDPAFRIEWPIPPRVMSLKDRRHPNFQTSRAVVVS